ncbi:MAG: VWA domain-containing protein [Bacteroidia bacterium]|nr:VWA domain-containing protein [Bacteroidia bacterium]
MKTLYTILLLQLAVSSVAICQQQYYLRGEVKDEKGVALQNVNILLHSTGFVYRSGMQGAFGILTKNATDTLTFSMDGYHKETVIAKANEYLTLQLRLVPVATTIRRDKLASLTKYLTRDVQRKWFTGDETYASIVENRFIESGKYPTTGVALNIDKASYSNVRRFINMNTAVPPDAVRIEEMLNYFNFGYDQPAEGETFKVKTTLTSCPWNDDNQLFFVNVSSKKVNLESLPPSHLVFLIDISGSMDMPNRLPLLKSAFHLLANNLREKDTVSIVVYGGAVGIMLQPTCGKEKEKINRVIDELEPGGSTPGESGIRIAYNLARFNFVEGGNNRVILATDGDFNVGVQTEKELDELITRHRESGIYLTCLGVGMGNYKDSKIQTLARKGNGNFYYIDNYQEAEKVLLKEFAQTLYAVADNVYLNISFEPSLVNEYRLIGFDNKVGALADTLSEIEGGEIGSTHTMMAAFEIIPGRNMKNNYAVTPFAHIELMYRLPGDMAAQSKTHKCNYDFIPFNDLAPTFRFATAVIIYGSILRSSPFVKNAGWNDVLFLAGGAANKEDITQVQFVQLVEKTKQLYSKFKKKKRGRGE